MDTEFKRGFNCAVTWALALTIVAMLAAGYFARGYQVEIAVLRERLQQRGSCDRPVLPTPMRKTT